MFVRVYTHACMHDMAWHDMAWHSMGWNGMGWIHGFMDACMFGWLYECLMVWKLFACLIHLVDWLIDWLIDWLTDWLTDGLPEWLADWLIDWLWADVPVATRYSHACLFFSGHCLDCTQCNTMQPFFKSPRWLLQYRLQHNHQAARQRVH